MDPPPAPSAADNAPSSTKDGVRVSVRVRPLNAREKAAAAGAATSWAIDSSSITQLVGDKPIASNSFHFDHVFEPHTPNVDVYKALAEPVVRSAVEGINGVIFAYGQTAAGKTYTMLGTEDDPGVTRRSIAAVFDIIGNQANRQFLLRASYIEIYNEVIRDLLVPGNDNLKIHEDVVTKRVFVESMEEVVVSIDQVMDIIAKGETARAVGETNMNERSSRSHTIFSLKIESREMSASEAHGEDAGSDDGVAVRASTLSLVDLAGSERAAFTKAQGMRLVEGGHINKSLLTLGTVINKLSAGEQRTLAHIPYRDSKLTRLLQPALGGNARTAIVCAVTPAILHMEETLSTLKFASRAKKVTNNAKTNEFLDDRAKLRRAEKEIAQLKSENERLKAGQPISTTTLEPASGGRLPRRKSSESHLNRIRAFEKKFEALSQSTHRDSSSPFARSERRARKRKYEEMSKPTLSSALNLFSCTETRHDDDHTGEASDAAVAELRKKLLEAERQMWQAQQEINCERQGMVAEVDQLVLSTDQAHRARQEAENECAEAIVALGRVQVVSLVDEIVTEAVTRSLISQDLRRARASLAKLRNVHEDNKSLKESLTSLQKEHAEVVKREKRGVGPVSKELKFVQNKLGDLEKKHKGVREKLSKTVAEKLAIEREMKTLERQNKALKSELEKHRNHNAKAQARASRDVLEEKKKLQLTVDEMKQEIKVLSTSLRERDDELSSMRCKLLDLERRVQELQGKEKSAQSALRSEMENVERLNATESSQTQEIATLTDEMGRTHLELEETKAELASARATSENRIREVYNEMEGLKHASSSEISAKEEELRAKAEAILKMQKSISDGEAALANCKSGLDKSIKALAQKASRVKELNDLISSLRADIQGLRMSQDTKTMERDGVREQLIACQKSVRAKSAEIMDLREHVETLKGENVIRAREVLKLSEAIHSRDTRIYGLKEKLDLFRRGEGAIAVLEKRVKRRDVAIKELNRRLELESKQLKDEVGRDALMQIERCINIEAQNAALLEEKQQLRELLERFEKERMALIDESRKLREKIKEKDMSRVKEAVSLKEKQLEEVRRKNQALRELPVNSNAVPTARGQPLS